MIINIPLRYLLNPKLESLHLKLPDPNIALPIPLKDYVGLSCGYRGFFVEDKVIGDLIKIVDKDETFCHVEPSEGNPSIVTIWSILDWKKEYERLKTVRKESERGRQERFKRLDEIEKLAKNMAEKMKVSTAITRPMAEQIVSTNNRMAAQMWGLDISDWHVGDDELQKIMKEQEPTTK